MGPSGWGADQGVQALSSSEGYCNLQELCVTLKGDGSGKYNKYYCLILNGLQINTYRLQNSNDHLIGKYP